MKVVTIWFSYREDARAIVQSALFFRREHPGIPCVVVDDALDPLDGGTVRILERMGVEMKRSRVCRNGNLRGLEWCREELAQMRGACERHGAEVLVKVDSDTLVLRKEGLLEPFNDPSIMAVGCRSVGRLGAATWLFGAACAYRREALERVGVMVGELPGWIYDSLLVKPECTHEDVFISRMILHAYGLEALKVCDWSIEGGLFKGWQYHRTDLPMSEYVRRFDCVTFGNRSQIKGESDPRGVVVRTMRAMMAEFRRQKAGV